ncbi:LemA family protein [Arenimonas composti]|nr:LemA family protein [Arenimonas composti]
MTLIVLAVIAAVIVFWGVGIYNGLVAARNAFRNAFAQIDVQLTRRYDLIPNLVEVAKTYLKHERETLEAVIQARAAAVSGLAAAKAQPGSAEAMAKLGAAEGGLAGALSRLMVVAEAYPDLKGNQNMMQLSEELSSTENKIAFARQAYNDSVMAYNNRREMFPGNLVAGSFGFQPASLLEISEPGRREPPKVAF